MISYAIDPRNVPIKIPIIAHDVGRSHDRSTAVVGGHCAPFFGPQLLLVQDFNELPLGIYGSQLANELAKVDQKFNRDCLIVADLSSDPTYAEVLLEMFGPRVIGVQIGRLGDGVTAESRTTKHGTMLVYNVGRTFLFDHLLGKFRNNLIRMPQTPEAQRAFSQLMALEREQKENGVIYKCPSGQYDDLGISLAMLAWAAQHLHLDYWQRPIFDAHRPPRPQQGFSWSSFI
jgi:hypothetical protein